MFRLRKILLLLVFFGVSIFLCARNRTRGVAIFNPLNRSAVEYPKANLFGAEQAIKVAGMPYIVTSDINEAASFTMLVVAPPVEPGMLTSEEKNVLVTYVRTGGILVATVMKDNGLFFISGIRGVSSSWTKNTMTWNMDSKDPSLKWFDDPLEQTISLKGEKYSYGFETVSYLLNGASSLGVYNDNTVAVTKYKYEQGFTYLIGFSFRNIITRNLLGRTLDAYRTYSNGFEPTSDTIMLFLRGIYEKHVPYPCWKKTSPFLSKATFIMTHDLCARSCVEMMLDFAIMENNLGITADYDVTTTYKRSKIRDFGGFYDENEIRKLKKILNLNHKITSHSVNHLPDFSLLPEGHPGNTVENYDPYYDGERTHGGSVYGEVELSKKLLDEDLGVNVRTFRSGYLAFNDKLYNVLEGAGYSYDTTRSANAVLTNFPYIGLKDRAYEGDPTDIYEIPMTISDVIEDFSYGNYLEIARMWLNITIRNARNYAPTVHLIHPNRNYKLDAEEWLLTHIPPYILITNIDSFGDFWRSRDRFKFWTVKNGNVLKIVIPRSSIPIDTSQSIVVENGAKLSGIVVVDEKDRIIPFLKEKWGDRDLLIHWGVHLKTRRFAEEAWSVSKVIGEIEVNFPFSSAWGYYSFTIYRREGKGPYTPIHRFTINDFVNGKYIIYDETVEAGKYYTYKVEVADIEGNIFAVSNEKTI